MRMGLSVPIVGKVLLILAILAVAVFAGMTRITAIQEQTEAAVSDIVDRDAAGIVWLARAHATAMNTARLTFEALGEPSGFRARQIAGRVKEETVAFAVRMSEAERSLPGMPAELNNARDAFGRLGQRIDAVLAQRFAQPDGVPGEELRTLARAVTAGVEEFDGLMAGLIEKAQAHARDKARASADGARTDAALVVRLVALALALLFLFAFLLLRLTVVRPLHRLIGTAKDLLGGRLDSPILGLDRRDEVGEIARAVRLLKETLAASDALAQRTSAAAQQMAAATAQAAVAVEQVSDGSQRQMQSVESITGSVSRTTSIIGTIASVSLSAKDRSRAAATQLADGMTQIGAMTAAVREIAVTSARINSITQSIGDLATRSNILSLNAAIEAARAGEHGRGFSVVAEEVGNLAQQTADLAREIALLAADSAERIQKGVSIATDVSGVMNSVTTAIAETDSLSEDIAQSMEEQGAVLRQIELSLQRLTEISNANATAGEQIAATMVELTRLADGTRRSAESVRRTAPEPDAA
ncbi:methyl-accepting chemotaxis protein [Azospirillum sp. RWY-5-1]|uniref:Methyl-accepting chemotaxis protein n=1 Tax=Azospirillum oleiclasticum TaxID=2735135 RepID=A0ABX2TM03_9PROT|nr:methyl-accepting chemotaxis protein [Azospirillum oleiclasticum]NYZ17755.1 methyl-accepting chemotaxis protein [Azospirillum oleiclasticum]NYZ24199.1 methyl-accepting chemotaxis protein [Azospirillum oleiclasticum]